MGEALSDLHTCFYCGLYSLPAAPHSEQTMHQLSDGTSCS